MMQKGGAFLHPEQEKEGARKLGKRGKLYGVSLGPGDPGLITRRAFELLERREGTLWAWPARSAKAASFALDIARRAGLVEPEGSIALTFPMTHDEEKLARAREKAAGEALAILHGGRDLLFLVEGDASTYSTFGHLARHLRALDERIEVETIAGVPSFNAAAARLDFPLAEVDDRLALLPANYGVETIDRLLDEFDALVLLKVRPLLDEIIALLERRGLLAHAAFIEKAGCPDERRVRDVASLRGENVNYLSLLLVRNPQREKGPRRRGCRAGGNGRGGRKVNGKREAAR
jgi:precorrin-2/cobalt-factor-2 C20-methyltransferase